MKRAWVFPLLSCWALSAACVEPCKPGYARHGDKCGKLPVDDGGQDADAASDAEGNDNHDAGQGATRDGGDPGSQPRDDSGTAVDSGSLISPECLKDSDCGDLEKLHCVDDLCAEHECYVGNPCTGTDVCDAHVCTPFVPPERFPAGFVQTNGGGTVASSMYRLRWSAGMPQPSGVATSNKHRLVLGPGAAP